MRKTRARVGALVWLTFAFWALALPPANAYIDPNSGSYLIQVLVGGLLGVVFAIKMFWRRIWGFLTSRGSRKAA